MPTNSKPASTLRLLTVHGSRYTCSMIDPPYGLSDLGALCRYMRLPFQPDWDLASCPSAASTKNGMRSGRSDQVSAPKLFNCRRLADLGRLDPFATGQSNGRGRRRKCVIGRPADDCALAPRSRYSSSSSRCAIAVGCPSHMRCSFLLG